MENSIFNGILFFVGAALTICFGILLLVTIVRLLSLFFKSMFSKESNQSISKRAWAAVVWVVLLGPFVAILLMITERDPAQDKVIRDKAFAADTQQSKRPPSKPKYSEPTVK